MKKQPLFHLMKIEPTGEEVYVGTFSTRAKAQHSATLMGDACKLLGLETSYRVDATDSSAHLPIATGVTPDRSRRA